MDINPELNQAVSVLLDLFESGGGNKSASECVEGYAEMLRLYPEMGNPLTDEVKAQMIAVIELAEIQRKSKLI